MAGLRLMGDPGYDGREEFCYGQQEQEEEETIFNKPSLNLEDFSSYELYKNSYIISSSLSCGQQEQQREEQTLINPYVNLHQFKQQQREFHPEELFLDHPLIFGDKGDSEPSSLFTEPSSYSEQELVESTRSMRRRRSIRQGKQKCVDSAALTSSTRVNLGKRKAGDELGEFASHLEMELSSDISDDDELENFVTQLEADLTSNEAGESSKVRSGPGESSLVGSSRSTWNRCGGNKKLKRPPGYNCDEEYERAREEARAMVKEYVGGQVLRFQQRGVEVPVPAIRMQREVQV